MAFFLGKIYVKMRIRYAAVQAISSFCAVVPKTKSLSPGWTAAHLHTAGTPTLEIVRGAVPVILIASSRAT